MTKIININAGEFDLYIKGLSELLIDAVNNEASVGFLPPLTYNFAVEYWKEIKKEIYNSRKEVFILLNDENNLIGSVQLAFSNKQNASHRAEIQKLFIHSKFRRNGYGKMLMNIIESRADEKNILLLVLDTRKGDASEKLYIKMGYIPAGEIPDYARSAKGKLHTTVFFYKKIHQ